MKVLGPWSTRDFIHRQQKSVKVWDQERVQFDLCLWRLIQRQIYGGKNPEEKVGGHLPSRDREKKKSLWRRERRGQRDGRRIRREQGLRGCGKRDGLKRWKLAWPHLKSLSRETLTLAPQEGQGQLLPNTHSPSGNSTPISPGDPHSRCMYSRVGTRHRLAHESTPPPHPTAICWACGPRWVSENLGLQPELFKKVSCPWVAKQQWSS